ncbi:NADPH oxidase 5 [Galendromus occidentalis]|uniref:NADPH oxidase 5 n=1 Tax=Galendromus occidentalis TaxID=34638 RepID=A0AAJ7L428_9ACAR|nr:NADPH oxidase 5 [Galendromus occidentalis]
MAMFWSRNFSRPLQLKLVFAKAADGGRCNVEKFKKLLVFGLAPHLAERLFCLFSGGKDHLTQDEFEAAVTRYGNLSPQENVDFVFELYDTHQSKLLTKDAIVQLLKISCDLHSIDSSDKKLENWAKLILGERDGLTAIDFKELIESDKHFNLKINVFDWFVKPEQPQEVDRGILLLKTSYYRRNIKTVIPVFAFAAIMLALGIERFFSETRLHSSARATNSSQSVGRCRIENGLLQLHSEWELWAKIFGKLLNFVSMMMLVLVLRNLITLSRKLGLSRLLPLDNNIYFHEMIGYIITLCSIAHTVCHAINVINLSVEWSDVWCILFTNNFDGTGLVRGAPIVTGWILLAVLAFLVVFSVPAIRRNGHFELFFNTHRLYVVYFIVLVLHAPKFWHWLLIPGSLFVLDSIVKITGFFRKLGRTHVSRAELFKGDTVALTIAKPGGFRFRCGDYIYLNIPQISKYEWHAFTISSAPEVDDLTVHIRVAGEWTRHLYETIDVAYKKKLRERRLCETPRPSQSTRSPIRRRHTVLFSDTRSFDASHAGPQVAFSIASNGVRLRGGGESLKRRLSKMISRGDPLMMKYGRRDSRGPWDEASRKSQVPDESEMVVDDKIRVWIDGPYGAPSSDFLQSPHPVLVATGIGVTPFFSIVQSIIHRCLDVKTECTECGHVFIASCPESLGSLKRVDFVWIVRDFTWVAWFKTALKDLMQNQNRFGDVLKDLIRIKIYVTSVDERVTVNNLLLKIALEKENASKNSRLHKLRSNIELGRPAWDQILSQVRGEHADATVFFCGSAKLSKELRAKCLKNELEFREEVF